MAQEKEIKLLLKKDLSKFKEDIIVKGYFSDCKNTLTQDIYLDTKDWRLYGSIAALRIRLKEGTPHSLSFKKFFNIQNKTADPWYIEELEVTLPLDDQSAMEKIFKILDITPSDTEELISKFSSLHGMLDFFGEHGFPNQVPINKRREIFSKNNTEICIDTIEKLGTLVEIESTDEDPIEIANSLLAPIEWERSIEGVSNIYMRINHGMDDHLRQMKNFDTDPAWNVWENEKEWYQNLIQNK